MAALKERAPFFPAVPAAAGGFGHHHLHPVWPPLGPPLLGPPWFPNAAPAPVRSPRHHLFVHQYHRRRGGKGGDIESSRVVAASKRKKKRKKSRKQGLRSGSRRKNKRLEARRKKVREGLKKRKSRRKTTTGLPKPEVGRWRPDFVTSLLPMLFFPLQRDLKTTISKLTLDGERLADVREAEDSVSDLFTIEMDDGEEVDTMQFRHPQRLARFSSHRRNFLEKN